MSAKPLNAKIIATGSYLPTKILSNQDLEKIVDTTDEWIFSRTGIKNRHIVAENETTGDMAYQAALDCINSANYPLDKIDLIIVATTTPDKVFPSIASSLQARLKLNNIAAFDLQAACAGFIYAIHTANAYIKSNLAKSVLVIGADTMSRCIDYTDRNTCVLFGDGAAAVILQAVTEDTGIIQSELHADGAGEQFLNIPGHIYNGKIKGSPFIAMDGKAVFKIAVKSLADVATSVLKSGGYTSDDIDWLVPHQANIRIIKSTAEHLGIPMEKVVTTLVDHGNTSAASIPLALDYAIKSGQVKRGDLLLLEGVGAGFTWGASLVKY